jgi:integrase
MDNQTQQVRQSQPQLQAHKHIWIEGDKRLVCEICGNSKLRLRKTNKEGLLIGTKSDGMKYLVRENRMAWFTPDVWLNFQNALNSDKAKLTAECLIQLGCRFNEGKHIEERDIDYERNTIRLRITKTKAKKGEVKGKPRTIPVNSKYIKQLKKHFANLPLNSKIGFLSNCAFNLSMKKALKKIKHPEWYMLSAHNIRKTHGNWLKILGDLRIMNVSATEICLRLGHSYEMFIHTYGSSSVLDNKDVLLIKQILGDLYQRQ